MGSRWCWWRRGESFWFKIFSADAAYVDDKSSTDWNVHELLVNMMVPLTNVGFLGPTGCGGDMCSSMVGWDRVRVEDQRRDRELTSR
jgi:hypothetical protein